MHHIGRVKHNNTKNRIYMLRAPERKGTGRVKVTIIVKMKN